MDFIEKIKADMYEAMKKKEKTKTGTLRTLLSKLKDKQINSGKVLSELEGLSLIKTLVKQRKESCEMYEKANRKDLAEKESAELKILEQYLPKSMSEEETKNLIIKLIDEIGVTDISQIGKIMPHIMKNGGGSIDGKMANKILRELLS
jgi:uncharacterized protein YqeY